MTNDVGALWAFLGGEAGRLESLSLCGGPWFASRFDVTGFARDAVAVASLAAAELHAVRSGRHAHVAPVTVDSLEASAAFRSEALFEAVGWERPPILGPDRGRLPRSRSVRSPSYQLCLSSSGGGEGACDRGGHGHTRGRPIGRRVNPWE